MQKAVLERAYPRGWLYVTLYFFPEGANGSLLDGPCQREPFLLCTFQTHLHRCNSNLD